MNRVNIQSTTRTNTLCIRTGTGSHTRPANAGIRNPRGLTRPAQDWSVYGQLTKLGVHSSDVQTLRYENSNCGC